MHWPFEHSRSPRDPRQKSNATRKKFAYISLNWHVSGLNYNYLKVNFYKILSTIKDRKTSKKKFKKGKTVGVGGGLRMNSIRIILDRVFDLGLIL